MPILDLADMTSEEVKKLDRARSCVVLTVSPVEEHGPHLPLANDLYEAEAVARRLLARLDREGAGFTFLLYPWLPLGADCFRYPGTVSIRPSTIQRVVEETGLALAAQGFERIMIASHHGGPRHNLALDAAAATVERRSRARVLSLAGRLMVDLYMRGGLAQFYERQGIPAADRAALDLDYHAGAFETAEMLVVRPDLVREGWRALEPVLVPFGKIGPGSALRAGRGLGYFGAPALASRELGEAYLDFLVERLRDDATRFLRGERVSGLALGWRLALRALSLAGAVRERLGFEAAPAV
jgi:creatinine amidohydrolase